MGCCGDDDDDGYHTWMDSEEYLRAQDAMGLVDPQEDAPVSQ